MLGIRGDNKITFISDRHIGLIDGIRKLFPAAYHGYCVRHICGNIRGLFQDGGIVKLFTKAAYATSTEEFEKNMDELKSLNEDAFIYIDDVGKNHYAISAFEGDRFGHLTNTIAESYSSLLLKIREKPHLHVLVDIYMYCMEKFYERKLNDNFGIILFNFQDYLLYLLQTSYLQLLNLLVDVLLFPQVKQVAL